MAQKADKLKLVDILKKKGFPVPVALSTNQIDFMQKVILKVLGNPNLSDQWWVKEKIS